MHCRAFPVLSCRSVCWPCLAGLKCCLELSVFRFEKSWNFSVGRLGVASVGVASVGSAPRSVRLSGGVPPFFLRPPCLRPSVCLILAGLQASHTVSMKVRLNALWFISSLVCLFVRPVSLGLNAVWSCRLFRLQKKIGRFVAAVCLSVRLSVFFLFFPCDGKLQFGQQKHNAQNLMLVKFLKLV